MPEKLKPCPFCRTRLEEVAPHLFDHPNNECVLEGFRVDDRAPFQVLAWNNRADRNATIEECAKIVDGHVQLHRDNGLPTTYEPLEVAAKRIRALKEVS